MSHIEKHRTHSIGWLRAAVLGTNDGIVYIASLILGVAAAGASSQNIFITGFAGLVAGAMAMAAGKYVSASSQADIERADLDRERKGLATDPKHEHAEIAAAYVGRGLNVGLASKVATQLMAYNALGAHTHNELGISKTLAAQPIQAAWMSAGTFAVGAVLPLLVIFLVPASTLIWAVAGSSILFLALLGCLGAQAEGTPVTLAATRVAFWGALAMVLTSGVGAFFCVA